MALIWESFPDESFKYQCSSWYETKTYAQDIQYLGHALSSPVMYYYLLLIVCDFDATEIFLLEPKGWEGGELHGPRLL